VPDNVVVGVDGSDASIAALGCAIDEATFRGVGVDAIHVWSLPALSGADALGGIPLAWEQLEASAHAILDEALAKVDARGVTVNPIVVQGSTAHVLIEHSAGAPMLVVGSRGTGGFIGLLVGSVAHQVLHHAPCPVLVVPAPDRHS
jgi:nucleotide-binding universal stress UspA family protein